MWNLEGKDYRLRVFFPIAFQIVVQEPGPAKWVVNQF